MLQQDVVNCYAGHLAGWYVYSAGRLDAISKMMDGETFTDLGHEHAMKFANAWIEGMSGALDGFVAGKAGVNGDMYKTGFKAALNFFDSHPEFRGR